MILQPGQLSLMFGHRLSHSTSWTSCIALILTSIVFASVQECTESGTSSCPSSARRVSADTAADIIPESFDEEGEEDGNDVDYSVHMQMRLTVDLPTEEDKEPHIHAAALSSFGAEAESSLSGNLLHSAKSHSASLPGDHDVLAMLAGPATVHKPPPEPVMPTAPASGSNLLLGIVVCALLMVVGILVGLLLWTLKKERQAKDQAELKAAAKAWMLDWALGFEPDADLEMKQETCLKVPLHKKKLPPMPNENDSSDTDEAEPEAESESEPAFELEEAVFQAAQVEVANEALDEHYGKAPEVRLADQIIPELPCH